MADQIGVELVANDSSLVSSTKAAIAALDKLEDQEKTLGKIAKENSVDQKKFIREFGKVEKAAATESAKALRKKDLDAKTTDKSAKIREKASAKEREKVERVQKASAKEKSQKAKAAVTAKTRAQKTAERDRAKTKKQIKDITAAATETTAALIASAVASGVLLAGVAAVAFKASETKRSARAMLDVLTNGRGDKQLAQIDLLAQKLGRDINDTRDNFIEFRRAGLDNKQSAQLVKLRADLLTIEPSGKLAEEAVGKVLAFTSPNGRQTAAQAEAAAKAMKLLAKQAHIAGDGSSAVAASLTTTKGALARLDNAKIKAFEEIGERIAPALDEAASSMANLVEKFLASKSGRELIDSLVIGITKFARGVDDAATLMTRGLGNPAVQFAVRGLGKAIEFTGDAVGTLAGGLILLPKIMTEALLALGKAELEAVNWGKRIIEGLIRGMVETVPKLLDITGNIGLELGKKFAGTLKIHSPSLVFKGFGVHISEGLQLGMQSAAPSGRDMAERIVPQRAELAAPLARASVFASPPGIFAQPSAAPVQSSQAPQINITLQGSASEDDARRIRKEIDLWWQSIQAQAGTH